MIVSVVGTRPQFVKVSILAKHLDMDIIDTGQHYDYSMAGQYLTGLKVHTMESAGDVASMYEKLLVKLRKYDTVIVYGDCNTTLAGALAAKQLDKKLVHVEAGCRSFDRRMVEESIRITVDHLADLNLCSTKSNLMNLHNEEMQGELVGDLSQDYIKALRVLKIQRCAMVTIHRAENMERMNEILEILEDTRAPLVWPIHPKIKRYTLPANIKAVNPLPYNQMLDALANSPYIITDSGGLQKEAYMLKTKCITLRDNTEWIETLQGGWNALCGTDKDKVFKALETAPTFYQDGVFGDGHAAERIAEHVTRLNRTGCKRRDEKGRSTAGRAVEWGD